MNDNDYIFVVELSVLICSNSLLSIFLHRYYLYVSSSTSGASQLWTHWPSALLFCIARTMPFIWLNFCPRSWALWPVTSVRRTAISHALHAQHCDLGMSWEAIHAACRLQSLIYIIRNISWWHSRLCPRGHWWKKTWKHSMGFYSIFLLNTIVFILGHRVVKASRLPITSTGSTGSR